MFAGRTVHFVGFVSQLFIYMYDLKKCGWNGTADPIRSDNYSQSS